MQRRDGNRRLFPNVAQCLRVARVDLDPEDVERLDRARDLQEPFRLEVEVQVQEDVDVGARSFTERRQLLAQCSEHVAIRVQLGEGALAREARRVEVGLLAEHEHVRLERRVPAFAHFFARVDDVLQGAQRRDLHRLRPREAIRPAVRPVEADPVAHGPAEQRVDRQSQRLRLDVE